MMRYLDTPVMLMKRNLSIVVLYNHLHILWLYVTGKQKVQFTIAGILECQADLIHFYDTEDKSFSRLDNA